MTISQDRLLRAIDAVVRTLAPDPQFLGFYEFEITGGTAATGFALKALAPNLPDLEGVRIWADNTVTIVYTPGARVLVGFVNGLSSRPFIAFDGAIIRAGDVLTFPTPGPAPVVKVPAP